MMNKKFEKIGEGITSQSFINDDGYILLVGKAKDSFSVYKSLKTNMDLLEGKIKSIGIPSKLTVINPCEKYPFGALYYFGVPGKEIKLNSCTVEQKKKIGKKLADFLYEMHNSGLHFDKEFSINHENDKAITNLRLLEPYFTKEENKYLRKMANEYARVLQDGDYRVTHGDLHGDNLLVNEKNELTGIIDFGNMAYTPIESDFAPIYNELGIEIWDSFIANYPKPIDLEKVKIAVYFRAITFFEYVQGWSKKAILEEVQKIRNTGIFDRINTTEEIFALYKECFPDIKRAKARVIAIINDANNHIISYREKDQLKGISVINGNSIYLLCVAKNSRNKGIGKKLLLESEAYIKSKGFDKIILGAGEDYIVPGVPMHDNAHNFFKKYGYLHSWGTVGCFDMQLDLKNFLWNEANIGDSINEIVYRFAKKTDIPKVLACIAYTASDFQDYYQNEMHYEDKTKAPVLIALDKDEVVGTLIISIETTEKKVGSVGCTATKHSHRGKGIATNMILLGTRYLKENGVSEAVLGYTYSGILKIYSKAGYLVCMEYFMGEKAI